MNRSVPPDDGATIIRTAPTGGPASDFAPSSTLWGVSLPEGLRLGEYEILSVIGEGGFGIVYLAYDHFLQRQVALKEYMPSSLAGRARSGMEVVVKSERHRETFQAGLKSFVNEARLLAQFDHPALVKVYRFWEANCTAYMVMPYCVGPTLKEALAAHPEPPDEAWLREHLLSPLLEALALLHKAQCLHRDIAPDNILLTDTGPLLLDFGAARQIIGDMSQTLTVVLKPGYAPIEQYGEVAGMAQGPWTDLYALAGVARYAITGKVPPPATTRILQDNLASLSQSASGEYSPVFLSALDAALAVKPGDRPQNVAEFQALLAGEARPAVVAQAAVAVSAAPAISQDESEVVAPVTGPRTWQPRSQTQTQTPTPTPVRQQAEAAPLPVSAPMVASSPSPEPGPGPSVAVVAPRRSSIPMWAAVGGATLLVAISAGWWVMRGGDALPPAAPVVPAAKAVPAAATVQLESVAQPPLVATPVAEPATPEPIPAPAPAPAPAAEPVVAVPKPQATPPAVAPNPAVVVASPNRGSAGPDNSARCSDILQKASLEPLSAREAAFLKSECK